MIGGDAVLEAAALCNEEGGVPSEASRAFGTRSFPSHEMPRWACAFGAAHAFRSLPFRLKGVLIHERVPSHASSALNALRSKRAVNGRIVGACKSKQSFPFMAQALYLPILRLIDMMQPRVTTDRSAFEANTERRCFLQHPKIKLHMNWTSWRW